LEKSEKYKRESISGRRHSTCKFPEAERNTEFEEKKGHQVAGVKRERNQGLPDHAGSYEQWEVI
jgi:hypothetical protein